MVEKVKYAGAKLSLRARISKSSPLMRARSACIKLQSGVGVAVGGSVAVGRLVSVGVGVMVGVSVMVGVGVGDGTGVLVGALAIWLPRPLTREVLNFSTIPSRQAERGISGQMLLINGRIMGCMYVTVTRTRSPGPPASSM